jgi:uncharacterized membrane protein (DUF4010 family)
MTDQEILLRLAVAALGGLAVGIEREWSARRERDHSRFGGVRTFLLLGLVGGLGATLGRELGVWAGALLLAGAFALLVAAYFVSATQGTIDATTEVAGALVVGAGALAGAGQLAVASALFAGTALVLVEKSRMHAAVERLRSEELAAGARFAVLALVVLPLLPSEPVVWLGGLAPQRLWGIVLLFAGISFGGYVALRLAGPGRGLGLAGLLGGVVSSTAVTLNFARESRTRPAGAEALAVGALAASAVMPLRVGALSAILNLDVARALWPALAAPLLLGVTVVVRGLRRGAAESKAEPELPANPLRLGAAIQMTLAFAIVLLVLGAVRERFGSEGLFGGAVVLGLTDLDALTYSMNRLATDGTPAGVAARALVVGMTANSLFKGSVALIFGAPRFRLLCGAGLALYAALFALGFLLVG